MLNITIFKERTKALCKAKGLSQKFVSESTGHGQFFLNDVWLGKRSLSDADLETIASALSTTSEYLLGVSDDPTPEKKTAATTDDIKVALFGGDGEVTDAMWDEVVKFAEYVKSKHSKGEI